MNRRSVFRLIIDGFAVVGVIAFIACLVMLLRNVSSSSRSEAMSYYYLEDLKKMQLPDWNTTNTLPLSPEQALASARTYLREKLQDVSEWDVESITLDKSTASNWLYELKMVHRTPSEARCELVTVLLNGKVWAPTNKAGINR